LDGIRYDGRVSLSATRFRRCQDDSPHTLREVLDHYQTYENFCRELTRMHGEYRRDPSKHHMLQRGDVKSRKQKRKSVFGFLRAAIRLAIVADKGAAKEAAKLEDKLSTALAAAKMAEDAVEAHKAVIDSTKKEVTKTFKALEDFEKAEEAAKNPKPKPATKVAEPAPKPSPEDDTSA